MSKLNGKELSELYPKQKSYDELRDEAGRRQLARQPRFTSIKIAIWASLGVFAVLMAYDLIAYIIKRSFSSPNEAIFSASFSILLSLATLAALLYFYTLINNLVAKVLVSSAILYAALVSIGIIAGFILAILMQYQFGFMLTIVPTLLFNFLATCFAVNFIVEHHG